MKVGVYYRVGTGWCYRVSVAHHINERGPFSSAKEAGIAMRSEQFYMRSVRRAVNRKPMTFCDDRKW